MYKHLLLCLISTTVYGAQTQNLNQSHGYFDNKFGGCVLVLDPVLYEHVKTQKITYNSFEKIVGTIMNSSRLRLPKDFVKRTVVEQKMYLEYDAESQKILSSWFLYCDTGAVVTRCARACYGSGAWRIDYLD